LSPAIFNDTSGITHAAVSFIQILPYDTAATTVKQINELRKVVEPVSSYTFPDPQDMFHREPLIAAFKTKSGNFDFVLIVIHTDPDYATEEINALPLVVNDAQRHFPGEKDFILIGDMNSDCSYFNENIAGPLKTADFNWLITDDMDTTIAKSDCTYDRIIITNGALEDYAGQKGVDYFDARFNMNPEQAKAVSDHYCVFAVFNTMNDTD
jgi:hypothetical protein